MTRRNLCTKKVFNYDSLQSNVDVICIPTAIVDLCRDKDNRRYDVFTHSELLILLILY